MTAWVGAVVVTMKLTCEVPDALNVADPEEGVQDAPEGAPEHDIWTVPAKPPIDVIVATYVVPDPGATEAEPGDGEIVKSIPVPTSITDCEPPGALSEIPRLAERAPPACAVKTTLIVQLLPEGSGFEVLHVELD